ncbi:alpha/beta fold hydrolase [Streptomyces sp. JB150]|uniref:alpha/beta fold hydrolase n=1 Tax=Streptomyces sp. JB150 TaxID=2714844 RepID=UPI00140A663B|nr:alpha/beta fold hydrolase [Streptomyces sp. JB150]QIJ65440.1 alpha/beta fold hydrolase [Streptomyces sp. JB150]
MAGSARPAWSARPARSAWSAHEFTAAAGTRVHAAVLGPRDAPEVVCVHGLGCSHRYWLPFARALAPRLRTVAVDLPGFGRTRGPARALDVRQLSLALADWMRVTGRGPAVLVANSVGCQVVVDLAVHSPELVGPVVLIGPTFDRHARTTPRQLLRLLADAPAERPSLMPALVASYADCGLRRALATYRFALHDPVERKLRHLRTPVVVARGSRDPIVPRAWAEEVTRLLPDGRPAEVPGAGHALNHSAPRELAGITRGLLRRSGLPAGTDR